MCFKLFETLILFGFLHGIHAIVGGKEADLPIPWQVAIRHVHYGQFCGGTILDSKTILSAAHCFPYGDDIPADLLYITAGDVHVDFNNPWLGYSVEEVIVHPDFGNGFYIITSIFYYRPPTHFTTCLQPPHGLTSWGTPWFSLGKRALMFSMLLISWKIGKWFKPNI